MPEGIGGKDETVKKGLLYEKRPVWDSGRVVIVGKIWKKIDENINNEGVTYFYRTRCGFRGGCGWRKTPRC